MAKKSTKKVTTVEISRKEVISFDEVISIAKNNGYEGGENLFLIQEWIRNKYNLHGEIFYSLFHKKWSINNYFVNTLKGERVNWDYKSINYDTYNDALLILIYNLLLCL